MPDQQLDPSQAGTEVERVVAEAAERKALVIGPLWPDPGPGRVAGPPWSFDPAQPHRTPTRCRA
jgi:hypothetical protein